MMGGPSYSDEIMMAFADDELPPEQRAEIARAMESDPELAARAEAFSRSRTLTRQAFQPLRDLPADSALEARIAAMVADAERSGATSTVIERMQPSANDNARPRYRLAAVAALLLSLATAAGGYLFGRSEPGSAPLLAIGAPAPAPVAGHLSTLASGETRQLADGMGEFGVIATFRIGGTPCREFEIAQPDGQSGIAVACFSDGAWITSFAMVTASNRQSFVPASSAEAVDAYLEALVAGSPLSPAEEAEVLRALR